MTLNRSRTRLSRRGQIATLLFVTSFVSGRLLALTVLTVMGVFGGLWLLLHYLALTVDRTKISASVNAPPTVMTLGQRWQVRYRLQANRTVGKTQLVESRRNSQHEITSDHIWIGSIRKGQIIQCATSVYADETQRVEIVHSRLWRSDPLGFVVRSWVIDPDVTWVCLPEAQEPSTADFDRLRSLTAQLRALDPPTDLIGVRPYEQHDDPRRIDWRRTSRTGSLMVRQLDRPHRHPHVSIEIGNPPWPDHQIATILGWIKAIEREWPESQIDVYTNGVVAPTDQLCDLLAANDPSILCETSNPNHAEIALAIGPLYTSFLEQ